MSDENFSITVTLKVTLAMSYGHLKLLTVVMRKSLCKLNFLSCFIYHSTQNSETHVTVYKSLVLVQSLRKYKSNTVFKNGVFPVFGVFNDIEVPYTADFFCLFLKVNLLAIQRHKVYQPASRSKKVFL